MSLPKHIDWVFRFLENDPLCFKIFSHLRQLSLVLVVFLNFFLKNLRDALIGRGEEVICQNDVLSATQVRIVVDGRVQIEQKRQVNWLIRIEQLVLEAETLNFVEIQRGLLGENLVDCDSSDRLTWPVIDLVKGQAGFTCIYHKTGGLRLKFPRQLVLSMSHERDSIFAEHIHLIITEVIFFGMLPHWKPKSLADDIIEWNNQEEASKNE